jgi:hypothetical protein
MKKRHGYCRCLLMRGKGQGWKPEPSSEQAVKLTAEDLVHGVRVAEVLC